MISVCRPDTSELEKKYVLEALNNNAISSTAGYVEKFENEFAKKIGIKYAIAVNSGGSALFLALKALNIGVGDEVIIPTFTMIATANAVSLCGAKVILVDSERGTGNINPDLIKEKITDKTKAIIIVHLYGHPCDMDRIKEVAGDIPIIEDAAEALGSKYKNKNVGTLGVMACFSLFANKLITTGEGGIIITDNKSLADELRGLRGYYINPRQHFDHKKIGYNMRMSSLEAAYGLAQIERFEEFINARRNHADYYTKHLGGLVKTPPEKGYAFSTYWMYLIKTPYRDGLMNYLYLNGVETRTGFFPMHWQAPYFEKSNYPVADDLGKTTMYLPSASNQTREEMDIVINHIKEFYEQKNNRETFRRRKRKTYHRGN